MKSQTLYLYSSLIKTYRKLLNLYKEIGELKLKNDENSKEYKNKLYKLKQFIEYENYLFSDKFYQLSELNSFITSISKNIENIEFCYLMESEEVLVFRAISKFALASLNNIDYYKNLTLEERKIIYESNLNLEIVNAISVFYITIIKEKIDNQKNLETKKILNKMMFYEIFSNTYLETNLMVNDFEIPNLNNACYSILNSNNSDINKYKNQIATSIYNNCLYKLLELSDENLNTKEGEAIIIFLLSRIKANLVLLPDEIIENLNYKYNYLIEKLKIDNFKIQGMISEIYSYLKKNIKKYRRND